MVVLRWLNATAEPTLIIQGDTEYRAAMTDILHQYNTENFQPSDLDGFSREGNLQRQSLTEPQDPCAGLNPSFDPFMQASQEISRHINATISKPIVMLGMSCPIFFSPQHQACLRSLITRTGLHGSLIYHQTSSSLAIAAANRIGMCACPYSPEAFSCDDDPAMVLSVDYTNVALTIHTFRNFYSWHDGGMFFTIRASPDRHHLNGKFWCSIMRALRSMVAKAENNRIDRIILSGTLANDSNLHHAILRGLDSGFTPQLAGLAPEQSSLQLHSLDTRPPADPNIAAASGVAYIAWQRTMRGCLDPCGWRRQLGLPICL
jgi:hypothetical protein